MAKVALERIRAAELQAQRIEAGAREKANALLLDARRTANSIVARAQKDASDYEEKQMILASKEVADRMAKVNEQLSIVNDRLKVVVKDKFNTAVEHVLDIIKS